MSVSAIVRSFNLEEIKNHSTEDNLWLVIENKVYDVSGFVSKYIYNYNSMQCNTISRYFCN